MDHFSRRVQGTWVSDKQPTSREITKFLGRTMRRTKAKPRSVIVDQGRQFCCRGFKAWCRLRKVRLRFGAVGRQGSIALVERLIRTLKEEFLAGMMVPAMRTQFQSELDCFATWFNGFRPHSALAGQTPNEVYCHRKPANRKPRIEPRAKWPHGSPCAEPQVRVKGKCGTQPTLTVRFHAGRKQLPIVSLRRVA